MPRRAPQRSSRKVVLPSDEHIEARLAELPHFEPFDTDQLVSRARTLARERGLDPDAAVVVVRDAEWRAQAEQLLKALGEKWDGEPDPTNWQKGFIKLASLHHGAARFAHQRTNRHANARKWTFDAEIKLLLEVRRLREQGYSERQAIDKASSDFAFPHREQTPGRRAKSSSRRAAAVRRQFQRLMEDARSAPDPLSRAFGKPDESVFETVLWLLTDPPLLGDKPDPPLLGDKRKRKKPPV